MKHNLRKLIIVILIIAVLFSFVGMYCMFFYRLSSQTEVYTAQLPLQDIMLIAVDSKSNIYLGLSSFSAIQVYDDYGQFIYGISFKNTPKGGFYFYIDDDDYVHAFSEGLLIEYVFSINGLKEENHVEKKDIESLFNEKERTNKPMFISASDIIYLYNSSSKKVILYDEDSEAVIKKITINSRKWPWSSSTYFFIGFISMLILFFLLIPKEKIKNG